MSHIVKIKKKHLILRNNNKDIKDELKLNLHLLNINDVNNSNNISKYNNFKLDNDYKYNLAAKLIEKGLKDDAVSIYKDLY